MRRQSTRRAVVLSVLCAMYAGRIWAGADVADMSLEQLMNEPVTSVSKKETKLNESAAAIAVVTQEDIRRLGITNLPDALRLVPGLDVAQISSDQWAVSSRGFSGPFANKLLVLIDGRSVYSPVSGGVFWNAQDIMMEDVDRIEVIRGPGATLWGANAVNGVINIITKHAQDSQGTLATATYGTQMSRYSARYGGALGPDFSFRTYVQYTDDEGFQDSTRTQDTGAWESVRGGFRIDGSLSASDTLTFQGDAYGSSVNDSLTWTSLTPPGNTTELTEENNGGSNVLGRWNHDYSATSTLTIQSFFDHVVQGYGIGTEHLNTFDVDLQHRFSVGSANDLLWGLWARRADAFEQSNSFDVIWSPAQRDLRSYSAFIQDEMTLIPERLQVTAGTKFEYTNITGSEVLPNLRLSWTPDERQTVWTAISRAAATSSLFNLDGRRNVVTSQAPDGTPILLSGLPNPNLSPEELLAYELGYRFTPSAVLSFDLSSFINHYRHLIIYVAEPEVLELSPAPPHLLVPIQAENGLSADSRGLEAAMHWQALPNWQWTASYTWLQIDARSSPTFDEQSPRHQFQVRSYLDLPHHLAVNVALYYVDAVSEQSFTEQVSLPPYVRADLGLVWKPASAWSLGIWGENLAQREHLEFPSGNTPVLSEIPRTAIAKIIWTF